VDSAACLLIKNAILVSQIAGLLQQKIQPTKQQQKTDQSISFYNPLFDMRLNKN
jgi:hypothetical protein